MLTHIENKDAYLTAIKADKVLVDFFATWCGPCSMLAPLVEKLAQDNPDISVIKVDVDLAPEIASLYDVFSIPTLLYIEKGEVVRKSVGYIPEPSLKKFVGLK
jgi:thioredoxin 1